MDEIRAVFFEECTELLEQLEAGLLRLEAGAQDSDTLDSVFRAVHSIKGGAGAFDLGALVGYSHEFETALERLRSGDIACTAENIAILLRAFDKLGDLVEAAANGEDGAAPVPHELHRLGVPPARGKASGNSDDFGLMDLCSPSEGFSPTPIDIDLLGAAGSSSISSPPGDVEPISRDLTDLLGHWRIEFEPLPDLFTSGNEPLHLFHALRVFGRLEIEMVELDLPLLEDLDPAFPHIRWIIDLHPSAADLTETEIESVFEFAHDLCVITIAFRDATRIDGPEQRSLPAPQAGPASAEACPAVDKDEPEGNQDAPGTGTPRQAPSPSRIGKPVNLPSTIRVDLDRIDKLVNLVGELVICQAMLSQGVAEKDTGATSDATSALDDLQQLTRNIQDSVMAIRAQPVRSLFQRMTRIVREAAQATGKDIRLETDGEFTEIDKTVVERLAEPLTHMIRNAIDHGIEASDARRAAGKSSTGTVHLSARQQSDRVVIEITDDGRGIDRELVLARAIDRGLVASTQQLEPAEIDRLLFLPGFSTATSVSSLSGRGVGMDVVQRSIRDLNGTIAIHSVPGTGCTITVSLPLTLAILDGMIVRSAAHRLVIPLASIIETQTVEAARIEWITPTRSVVMMQDRFVPLLDLAQGMGFAKPAVDGNESPEDDCALLFVQPDGSDAYALRVDAIEAQRQVVIKGIGESFGRVPCVSAATILGNGQVALIVDPSALAPATNVTRASALMEVGIE